MGLGSLSKVPLAHARAAAQECRKLLGGGLDPVAERNAERERATLEAAKAITFSEAAERYIAAHQGKWRNEKHIAQWRATIATYAGPVFGKLPVQAVDTGLVLSVRSTNIVKPVCMSVGYLRVRSPLTCQCCNLPSSN